MFLYVGTGTYVFCAREGQMSTLSVVSSGAMHLGQSLTGTQAS